MSDEANEVTQEQCAKYAVQQATKRGEGGIVYIQDSKWAYLLPHEWSEGIFREKMQEAVDADAGASFFVVIHPPDNNLNVFSIPKRRVVSMCLTG